MDVVSADISALLDMNVLARELLIAETVNNRLVKRSYVSHEDGSGEYVDEWYMPMYRSRSFHVFVDMMLSSRIY